MTQITTELTGEVPAEFRIAAAPLRLARLNWSTFQKVQLKWLVMPMKPLLFMHIHKTAGQSFTHYLKEHFPPEEICPCDFEWDLLARDPDELKRYRLFRGHISMPALARKIPEFDTVALLRHPHDRLVSAFHFWRSLASRKEANIPSVFYEILEMTFAEFLTSPKTRPCVENVQARLLCGANYGETNEGRTMVYGDVGQVCWDRFVHVGLTERLDVSIQAVATHYGWAVRPAPTINVGSKKTSTPTDEERALLEWVTGYDMQVYNHVLNHMKGCLRPAG